RVPGRVRAAVPGAGAAAPGGDVVQRRGALFQHRAAGGGPPDTEPCESGPIQGILEPERASRAWVAEVWHLGMGCHVGCVRIRLECSKAPQAVASWFVVSQVSVNGVGRLRGVGTVADLSRDGCGPSPPWSPEREAPAPSAAAGTQPSVAAGEAWQPRGTLGRQGPLVPSRNTGRRRPRAKRRQRRRAPPRTGGGGRGAVGLGGRPLPLAAAERGPGPGGEKRRLLFKCAGVRDLLFAGGPGAAGAGPRLDGCRVEIARGAVEAAVRALEPLQPERREHPGAGEAAALPAEADLVEEVVALLQAATAKKERNWLRTAGASGATRIGTAPTGSAAPTRPALAGASGAGASGRPGARGGGRSAGTAARRPGTAGARRAPGARARRPRASQRAGERRGPGRVEREARAPGRMAGGGVTRRGRLTAYTFTLGPRVGEESTSRRLATYFRPARWL
ncbi:unnamed protein product, partial [Prorocentrum cordatum]